MGDTAGQAGGPTSCLQASSSMRCCMASSDSPAGLGSMRRVKSLPPPDQGPPYILTLRPGSGSATGFDLRKHSMPAQHSAATSATQFCWVGELHDLFIDCHVFTENHGDFCTGFTRPIVLTRVPSISPTIIAGGELGSSPCDMHHICSFYIHQFTRTRR